MLRKNWISLCGAMACTMMLAHSAAAQTTDEQAVATAVEQLRAAMVSPINQPTLAQLTDVQLSYGHSNGVVQTQAEFIGQLVSGASTFVSIALSDQTVSVRDDVAVVRHTLSAVTNDGGKPGNVALKILMVWQKNAGQWRLLARQAVRFATPT